MIDQIKSAIDQGQTLQCEYQGHPRHVVPLCVGGLKNGRSAMLCYKIEEREGKPMELFMRLYHLEKMVIRGTGIALTVDRKIDYYLTKHFSRIESQCGEGAAI